MMQQQKPLDDFQDFAEWITEHRLVIFQNFGIDESILNGECKYSSYQQVLEEYKKRRKTVIS